jgi:ADP-ribose pyrophosphatase
MREEILHSEYLYRGKLLKLRLDQVRLENQHVTTREIVEHRGAVAMVALDEQMRVLLVRQYRAAAGRELLEIPAGTLEEGEDPLVCATRELYEETGYRAMQWNDLGFIYAIPGYCTEKMNLYLVRQLSPGDAHPETDEIMQVESVPLAQVLALIERGEIVDAKTIIGILRVARMLRQ